MSLAICSGCFDPIRPELDDRDIMLSLSLLILTFSPLSVFILTVRSYFKTWSSWVYPGDVEFSLSSMVPARGEVAITVKKGGLSFSLSSDESLLPFVIVMETVEVV